MEKKEAYKQPLPPYPGQAFLVTFCLWNAVPPGALPDYTGKLQELSWKIAYRKKQQLYDRMLKELENEYSQVRRHYFNAYDRLMAQNTDRSIDLTRTEITGMITDEITLAAPSQLENYAWCIMPNHVHWVFRTREKDNLGNPVSLPGILESVKDHTTHKINTLLERQGPLWHKENFDTPLRDHRKLVHAIEFTLNNPVAAKLTDDPTQWPGSWGCGTLRVPF